MHSAALLPLLHLASSGFPSQVDVEATLISLHADHGVLKTDDRFVPRAALLASECWRTMTKHCYNLAMSGEDVFFPEVRALVAAISIPPPALAGGSVAASSSQPAADVPRLFPPPTLAIVPALAPPSPSPPPLAIVPALADAIDASSDSDDSVIIGELKCMCLECLLRRSAEAIFLFFIFIFF